MMTSDVAMASALEELEGLLGRLRPELATAVFELVLHLRHQRIDRPTCRIRAAAVRDDLAATGLLDTGGPLSALLDELAVLPDGPERHALALDPTPDPSRPLEMALADGTFDPAGQLFVPVLDLAVRDEGLALRFLPLVVRGAPMIAAFTSAARVSEHATVAGVGEVPLIELDARELARVCPAGHGIAVNPGAVLGCTLSAEQVVALSALRP